MPTERFNLADAEILVGSDAGETYRIAAGQFAMLARKTTVGYRPFTVALSGGQTPRTLLATLAAEPFSGLIPWQSIQFYWGDERNVPPNHRENNYHMAYESLLSRVPVSPENIHRIATGDGTALEAAQLYERTLREKLPLENQLPRLDLVLLGLGSNGHTASLFPHQPALRERQHLVVADHVDEVNGWRITLTVPVINNASQVTFLVLGEEKAEMVRRVIEGPRDCETIPAQLIAPSDGALTWILDSAAASQLTRVPEQGT